MSDTESLLESTTYARKIPFRTLVLSGVSLGLLVINLLSAHAAAFPPQNPVKGWLFTYNMLAQLSGTFLMIVSAAALFTYLAHIHSREALARQIAMQRAIAQKRETR